MAKEGLNQGKVDKVPRYLERALGIHGRAKALTQQLLTFSKGGAPVRKTLSLGSLLRANAAFALSGSSVTCEFALDPELWPCEGDENQLGQVFDNLFLPSSSGVLASGQGPPPVPGGRGRVLVMDDEALREVSSEILGALGYEPTTCDSGEEAVRLFREAREGGRTYDAAILDLTVPGDFGGAEAARRIRHSIPEPF